MGGDPRSCRPEESGHLLPSTSTGEVGKVILLMRVRLNRILGSRIQTLPETDGGSDGTVKKELGPKLRNYMRTFQK